RVSRHAGTLRLRRPRWGRSPAVRRRRSPLTRAPSPPASEANETRPPHRGPRSRIPSIHATEPPLLAPRFTPATRKRGAVTGESRTCNARTRPTPDEERATGGRDSRHTQKNEAP